MMRKIPLYAYVATNNSRGAAEVMRHFGLESPQSQEDVVRGLRHVQSVFGKEGIMEIAKAHPDRALILSTVSASTLKGEAKSGCDGACSCKENKSNSCGCHSNANGNGGSSAEQELAKLKEEQINAKIEANKSNLTKEDIASEVKKVLDKTNPFIKNNLPYIALGGVALFFIMGTLKR